MQLLCIDKSYGLVGEKPFEKKFYPKDDRPSGRYNVIGYLKSTSRALTYL